jgi:hypothetical protein
MKYRLNTASLVVAAGLFCAVSFGAPRQGRTDRAATIKEAASKPTPHATDGHPDLSGYWGEPQRTVDVKVSADGKTRIAEDRDAPELDDRAQSGFKARAADNARRPPYKPQFVTKQRELMYTASRVDPGIHCYPLGVPRIGAPTEIVQTPSVMYFMYAAETSNEDMAHTFRVVPIGGEHNKDRDGVPDGDSIAYWEGDTLVVDVVNIDPDTWLDGDGTFHDENLHVIERFRRKGNTLEYDVMIEDRTLFTGPWKPVLAVPGGNVLGRLGSTTRVLRQPGEHAMPDYPCVERDREHKVNNDRF